MIKARSLLAALLACCLTVGAALADKQVTLTFLGDCTIGGEDRLINYEYGFPKVAEREGYGYFFEKVLPLLSQDDLTIANFEGVLKDNIYFKANKTYCFRGLTAYADILTLGSVEVVSLANNHTGDYTKQGYQSTWKALSAAGVHPVDIENHYITEINGVRIAVLGIYAAGYFAKRAAIRDAVQRARDAGADAVVCMVHAGQEYYSRHSRTQTQVAQLLIDSGADVVVCSHPHVLQGTEVYRQRNILYSIGNFVFGGNATVRSYETVIARFTLTFDDNSAYLGQQMRLYPAHISGITERNNYQPVLVSGEQAEAVWEQIDNDSEGQPAPVSQTDEYREYAYLPAQTAITTP